MSPDTWGWRGKHRSMLIWEQDFTKELYTFFFFLKVESHVTQTGLKLSTGVQPSPKMLGTEPSTSRILSEHYTN